MSYYYNSQLERTIEEMKATLDRLKTVEPDCREKSIAITHTEEAIMWLEKMNTRLDREHDDED